MKTFGQALDRLAEAFQGFAAEIKDLKNEESLEAEAGEGEEIQDAFYDDDHDDNDNVIRIARPDNGIQDDQDVTLKSGDLRKVVNAYRALSRMHREGRLADQDTRFKLHQHIRKVKHLIRAPRH